MGPDRCPSCAASVRPGTDWCTLCYADLRPPPLPVERAPYPVPSSPPAYAVAAPAAGDALQAPFEHVLAAVYGGSAPAVAVQAPAAPAVEQPGGWPCTSCGQLNTFDRATCGVCTAPFGAGLRSEAPVVERKRVMLYAIGFAAAFLVLMAVVTFALTKAPPTSPGGGVPSQVVVGELPEPEEVPQAPLPSAPGIAPQQPGAAVPSELLVPGQSPSPAQQAVGGEVIVPGQNLLPSESASPVQ